MLTALAQEALAREERYTLWKARHPWLGHRVIMELTWREYESIQDVREALESSEFDNVAGLGKKFLERIRWLVDRNGEEPPVVEVTRVYRRYVMRT